jgi:putative ABC transport system substrate-binding protein
MSKLSKKNLWKRVAAMAALAMLSASLLTGCNDAAPVDPDTEPDIQEPAYKIGVIQYMEHPSLDAAYEGFQAALADNGYADNISYDYQNAQGDVNNLSTISDRMVSGGVDLVLSITTDATQAIASKTTEIPILGTAVTSYSVAGLIETEERPGTNVSGTSDMNPVSAQIDLVVELVPEVETIGLIYNSSEDNSVLQIQIAKEAIEDKGLSWHEVTVTNTAEVQQAMQSLVGKCQAIYIPTDNTLASSMATVHAVAGEAKIPTICGALAMVNDGGLASMGIDYYQLGYQTGLMAIEVLNGKDPAEMPIQYAASSDQVVINGLVAEEMAYQIPEKYLDKVIGLE